MNNFIISTDSTCDLPMEYCHSNNIDIHSFFYKFNDNEIYTYENPLDPHLFYQRMRDGEMPTTMAINPEDSRLLFEKRVSEGFHIIHISFSSALSSAYQNAVIACNEVMDSHKNAKITVIDSLSASMGQGLLVFKAVEYMKKGHSYDEVVEYIENIKLHISHQFTVDDLFHLHRGGRVSKATAIVGTLIDIKPLLHVNDQGQLTPLGKTRGRKKSLIALTETMFNNMGDLENNTIMISHGDALEDADFVASMIKDKLPHCNIMINFVCPTIGAHSGPGTIALFFHGIKR